MKEFYEGIILINIGTSYLLLFQYFSHGLLFLETSHMTFPTKVIVQNEAKKTTSLAWRTFVSKHRRYRCQTIIPVRQRISNIFLYVSISPINRSSYEAFLWFRRIKTKYLPKSFLRENNAVTGRISPIYERYYNLMEVLYIFPMIFKMKPIFDLIYLNVSFAE